MRGEGDRQDQAGRSLGPRAQSTHRTLLDSTAELLSKQSVREVRVVDIARQTGSSPATFYQYFKDVNEAVLVLAEQAAEEMPAVIELIDGSWEGQKGLETSRAIVRAFVDHWDSHRSVLLVRNLYADEGDRRFMNVRRRVISPVIEQLALRIEESQARGRVSKELHPAAAAAAMASILERLAAHHREIEFFGAGRDELIESCARILFQTVAGNIAA